MKSSARFSRSVLLIVALAITPLNFSPIADAATKSVAIKKVDVLTTAPGAEGLLISGKTLITYVNTGGVNSNVVLTGLDSSGTQLWQKNIDSGADEIALAGAVDSSGNLWLAGASAQVVAAETTTVQLPPDNPDGVVAEPVTKLRSDMNLLTMWKLSPTGDLLATYSLTQPTPALISAISANASGVSLVGRLADQPFALSMSSTGAFGKLITIGTSKTQLNAVVRSADSTMSVFGSSSETLGGKKNSGIRDGILIKINKAGAVTSVVRSSAPKADRSWNYSDVSLTLTGYVKTGKKIESAITKFTAAFAPTWTIRIPSSGASIVVTGAALTYAALGSNYVVTGVSGWKPTTTQLLLLAFDSKGVIASAYGASELSNPLALAYSKEIGLYGLAQGADGSLSIFHIAAK
jgi:hypothetical protein